MSLHQRAWLRTPSFTSANSVDLNKPVWMAYYFMLHLWTVKSHSIKFLPSLNFAIIVLESHVSIQIKCWNDIHQLSWQRFQVLLLSQLLSLPCFAGKNNPLLLARPHVWLKSNTELFQSHFHLLQVSVREPKSWSSAELPLCLLESDIIYVKLKSWC